MLHLLGVLYLKHFIVEEYSVHFLLVSGLCLYPDLESGDQLFELHIKIISMPHISSSLAAL